MSTGLSQTYRQAIMNVLFKGGSLPTFTSGVFDVSLHTAQPTSGNEVGVGVGYTAFTTSTATWNSATAANPSVVNNAAQITFGTATGVGWGTITFWGLWKSGSRSAGDLVAYGSVPSQAVVAGNTPSFAATALFTQMSEV